MRGVIWDVRPRVMPVLRMLFGAGFFLVKLACCFSLGLCFGFRCGI